jgi:hypothetical protein
MRKVLLTVVSAALMGASTLSGAVVPNAFAQTEQVATPTPAELDALQAEVASLEASVSQVCAQGTAQCEALAARITGILATLVANNRISDVDASSRLAQMVSEISEENPQLAANLQSELLVNTASTGAGAPGADGDEVGGADGDGDGAGGAPAPVSPT